MFEIWARTKHANVHHFLCGIVAQRVMKYIIQITGGAELREQARRIASKLLRRGDFKKPVLVAMEKEPRTIAAFLGCAYSGKF